jgi:hypothetical protein
MKSKPEKIHISNGTALIGEHISDGEKCRYEGFDIDMEETKTWQLKYGKFGELNG